MWLIAVDEAGYGPKLGPLVVGATLWQREAEHASPVDPLAEFDSLTRLVDVDGVLVRVDDSKRVFQSRSARKRVAQPTQRALDTLHRIISVACHEAFAPEVGKQSLPQIIARLIPDDLNEIAQTPWLCGLLEPDCSGIDVPAQLIPLDACRSALKQWRDGPWRLKTARLRVVTARQFNRFVCGNGNQPARGNKSDLLSEVSLSLARQVLATLPDSDRSAVACYFDRQGGRRYYAGVIQQRFADHPVRVIHESAQQSSYCIDGHRATEVHFTVKGDRFAPVALSSLFAKYLREVMMSALNQYFHAKWSNSAVSFVPTAGYPVDADRFLASMETIRQQNAIADEDLIRSR